jgi:hypothetical protein
VKGEIMIKEQIKAVTTAVTTNVVNPMQNFYKENSSTINAAGAITFSILSTATAIKNSEEIIHTIRDAYDIYPTLVPEQRRQFMGSVVKRLAPLVAPIIIFQGTACMFIMLNKKQLDTANQKLADTTAALVMANNAIAQYQEFQKKAEAELSEKKVDKIKKEIAQEEINNNPQTKENTVNEPYVNQNYVYWDEYNKRYINSDKSPVEIENFCRKSAYDLADGNFWNDEFTYYDIYEFMAPGQGTEGSKFWGWRAKTVCRSGKADSSEVAIDIIPSEKPDHQTLVYYITFKGRKLFDDTENYTR